MAYDLSLYNAFGSSQPNSNWQNYMPATQIQPVNGLVKIDSIVDMVKDLAEAEKSCWEAQYYRSAVTESMEKKYGYSGMPGANAQSGRMGYGNMGYGTMGYGSLIDKIGEEYRNLPPEERVTMKSQILTKLGSM